MSGDAHPLWPVIRKWAAMAPPPLVEFAPIQEFQREIDLAALLDPKLEHEHAKVQEWRTYTDAAALGLALWGGDYNIEFHAIIYHAAHGNDMAFALCEAAGAALHVSRQCGERYLKAFSAATRLDGFLQALEVWTKARESDNCSFCGPDRLSEINREIVRKGAPGADFWIEACREGFDSDLDFFNATISEGRRADEAERGRKRRAAKQGPAKYRHRIEWGWLPLSLWARTAKDIAYLLDPELKDFDKEIAHVASDISDFHKQVGMPSSHRGREHGATIERAEKASKKVS